MNACGKLPSASHGLNLGGTIYFHEDHILIVHASHSREIASRMGEQDSTDFWRWVQEKMGEEN